MVLQNPPIIYMHPVLLNVNPVQKIILKYRVYKTHTLLTKVFLTLVTERLP
jgi:hypothetical protein